MKQRQKTAKLYFVQFLSEKLSIEMIFNNSNLTRLLKYHETFLGIRHFFDIINHVSKALQNKKLIFISCN